MSKLERWELPRCRVLSDFYEQHEWFPPHPCRRLSRLYFRHEKQEKSKWCLFYSNATSTTSTSGTSCPFLFLSLSVSRCFYISSSYSLVRDTLFRPWNHEKGQLRIFIVTNRRFEASKDKKNKNRSTQNERSSRGSSQHKKRLPFRRSYRNTAFITIPFLSPFRRLPLYFPSLFLLHSTLFFMDNEQSQRNFLRDASAHSMSLIRLEHS